MLFFSPLRSMVTSCENLHLLPLAHEPALKNAHSTLFGSAPADQRCVSAATSAHRTIARTGADFLLHSHRSQDINDNRLIALDKRFGLGSRRCLPAFLGSTKAHLLCRMRQDETIATDAHTHILLHLLDKLLRLGTLFVLHAKGLVLDNLLLLCTPRATTT
jgi:hypothetical protein